MNKILIIDGHSLAYRCYYAVKNTPEGLIVNPDGVPITIATGFLRSLSLLLKKHQPTHLAVCFDPGGKTWRHQLYPEYKANRIKETEEQETIGIEIRNLQTILKEKGIAVCKVPNFEADDVIATICDRLYSSWEDKGMAENDEDYSIPGLKMVISSADKDLLQLVDDDQDISVDYSHGKNSKLYTEKEVFQEFGIRAFQIPDYKALVGDKSDNIPGVKGIGKISATHLLRDQDGLHHITAIVGCLDKIKPVLAKKIEPEKDKLKLWYKLTKLENNIKGVYFFLDKFANTDIDRESATAIELGIEK